MDKSSGSVDSENTTKKRISSLCPMESFSTQFQPLDTVRTLHQTVVSLRTALEEAKSEIQRLRNQISAQSDIKEGAKKKIEKESTKNAPTSSLSISAPSSRQKDHQQKQQQKLLPSSQLLQSTLTSPLFSSRKTVPSTFSTCFVEEIEGHQQQKQQQEHCLTSPCCDIPVGEHHQHHLHHHHHQHKISTTTTAKSESERKNLLQEHHNNQQRIVITPDISIVAHRSPIIVDDKSENGSSGGSKMGSKIDVKIKVMSNIKVDGSSSNNSSNSSETANSSAASRPSSQRKDIEEDGKNENLEEKSKSSRRGLHLHTTTEDNIKIHKDSEGGYVVTQSSKENLNVDDNDNSQSEGDNSVFIEDEGKQSAADTSQSSTVSQGKEPEYEEKEPENKEEVDDIELIFSSEETRDPIQEDLVSISEYDPWQQPGKSGTPVLVKFSSLPSDQGTSTKKRIQTGKLSTSTTYDAFLEPDTSGGILQQKSIESTDSLDLQTSFKSSSLEKDYSGEDQKDEIQPLGRDESFDFFNPNDFSTSGANRKWTNYNVLVETDISKCGIVEETTTFEMYRRNTCPNPPAYRSIALRDGIYNSRHTPSRLASKYARRLQYGQDTNSPGQISRPARFGPKRSSSAQTDISALPGYWKSESQLTGDRCHLAGPCTLPSKFVPTSRTTCPKHFSKISERTQEARRILLSDINFTSMVPELSRSADHLCQDENRQETGKQSPRYYKGNLLKTPDYGLKGITPSVSMTSPGVSQWTVNESSFGTQTIQTGESWGKREDSFDSCKSYSTGGGSRYGGLDRHHRSRSVPSIRCAICKLMHHGGIRTSESMNYAPRVTFQEPNNRIRGSLPDLRYDCVCSRRYCGSRIIFPIRGDSSGSTDSLLDEADTFVRKSMESALMVDDISNTKWSNIRRMSENDIQRDYVPSKQSLPFLPRTAKCLKPGHLAKVISKSGRVVVGRVRYVGPLAKTDKTTGTKHLIDDLYVGVQLQSKCGDCDGTFEGRKFFECEPQQGLFVPFKKVVMAWTS